jgi:hypothetical protein
MARTLWQDGGEVLTQARALLIGIERAAEAHALHIAAGAPFYRDMRNAGMPELVFLALNDLPRHAQKLRACLDEFDAIMPAGPKDRVGRGDMLRMAGLVNVIVCIKSSVTAINSGLHSFLTDALADGHAMQSAARALLDGRAVVSGAGNDLAIVSAGAPGGAA